jgi:hypothetical protein
MSQSQLLPKVEGGVITPNVMLPNGAAPPVVPTRQPIIKLGIATRMDNGPHAEPSLSVHWVVVTDFNTSKIHRQVCEFASHLRTFGFLSMALTDKIIQTRTLIHHSST